MGFLALTDYLQTAVHGFWSSQLCSFAYFAISGMSVTAEKHYTIRPLELLELHHEKIEAWTLEQADIKFDPSAAVNKLRVANEERPTGQLDQLVPCRSAEVRRG